MNLREELKSAGTYPTGPVSAWPRGRMEELLKANKVKASPGQMVKGALKTAASAVRHGKVSAEIREERYDMCKSCPFFLEDSKRCSECGCFMEAKTWVGGDPKSLCPKQKWER